MRPSINAFMLNQNSFDTTASTYTYRAMLGDLVNHVVLPERLPEKQEMDISLLGPALTERVLQASRMLRDFDHDNFQLWDDLRRVLLEVKQINRDGPLDKAALVQAFRQLEPGGFIILHVKEQNAGMLVSRPLEYATLSTAMEGMSAHQRLECRDGNAVIFEAFEASPRSEDVLAAPRALLWDFPGVAVTVPYAEFADESFQLGLSGILHQSSAESISRFAARAHKSGSTVIEIRDTTDPAVITQMVITALEAYGHRISPQLLRKRVRDDVCWSDGAEVPWRRCASWLVLRVGVARYLCMKHGGEVGRARYKFLMCFFLASLLRDSVEVVSLQVLHNLRAKLARRLAKLEAERQDCSPAVSAVHGAGFSALGPFFHSSLQMASDHIGSVWSAFREKVQRPIRPLPCRAETSSLELSLPKSGVYLESILLDPFPADRRYCPPARFDGSAVNQVSRDFAGRYWRLKEIEHEIEDGRFLRSVQALEDEKACLEILRKIDSYLQTVGLAYESMAEQKSLMILTIMELWMMIDERATGAFDLLLAYHPVFFPEALDVLHLPRYVDMCRLQRIQIYLSDRIQKSGSHAKTIFEDPSRGCFAERYFDERDGCGDLRSLQQHIEEHAERMRKQKERELERLNEEFRDLERKIAESACIYIQDGFQSVHDDRGCRRCYLWRQRRRMRVKIYEHPLPMNPTQSKAVIFELRRPPAFSAYRSATWTILSSLAYPDLTGSATPRLSLQEYTPLRHFMRASSGRVSLASTRKSFLDTHYCWVSFPADTDDVFLPNGLKLGYHDPSNKTWPGRRSGRPSFAHHFAWALPPNSALECLRSSPSFAADSDGPSSHEIIASQTKCPAGLSVHEFMAYQGLFAGKYRRWPSILVELGSSNLNFSKQETTAIVAQLAAQAGPGSSSDPLRIVHGVFREETFCTQLLEQIGHRLVTIASNWRETNLMDLLLTLLLRLTSLASEPVAAKALEVLEAVRNVTNGWVRQLRDEMHRAKDSDASRRCSRYALWAALLCRRTYAGLVEDCGEFRHMQPDATQCFVEASIALQDNLVSDPAALPAALKQAIIRDVGMRFRMRGLVRRSIECSPGSLTDAIDTVWPLAKDDRPRSYSDPHFLGPPYHWWVEFRVSGNTQARQQTVHYEMIEGHLLIDQKPLGRLPEEHRSSIMLEELFGKQNLLTYPSCLRGMTYVLGFTPNEHQIHIGFRNGSLIIRACLRGAVLELIPRSTFGEFAQMDLPASLVENCVHWLDVQTGLIEVRQNPDIWIRKLSNWTVDVRSRFARRRNSVLVDPHSPLFQQVARVFHRFEHPARLTVYQPNDMRGNLSVELRRLELSFVVNNNNLLYCRELKAEVDPDQDAGTWYGLDSKIVVRDAVNPRRRSILVPMGPLSCSRNLCHVAIGVQNVGDYGIFAINDVLGRLDCPNESRLLYLKAQLHAYTSFILPDPLIRRTGTEEALHCLRSGLCQPWMPINPNFSYYLGSLARLTPKRVYYPQGLKRMQQVSWDPDLTTNIQDDRFLPFISRICEKSASLSIFSPKDVELKLPENCGDSYLSDRSHGRRRAFWRSTDDLPPQTASDTPYDARDRHVKREERARVYEAVSLIRLWDVQLPRRPDLVALLQGWPNIQGHGHSFNKTLLSDLMNIDFPLEWGSLVDFCRRSRKEERHALGFLFAVISFRPDLDADVIRVLVAYAVSDSLKGLEPPEWPSYSHFRHMQAPSVEYLLQLMNPLRIPCRDAEQREFGIGGKLRGKLEREQREREQQIERDASHFSKFLARQWPCVQPTVDGLDGSQIVLLDASQALEVIRCEWMRLFQNWELSGYIEQVQKTLDRCISEPSVTIPPICTGDPKFFPGGPRCFSSPQLREELRKSYLLIPEHTCLPNVTQGDLLHSGDRIASSKPGGSIQTSSKMSSRSEVRELEEIVVSFTSSPSAVRQSYGEDLERSVKALKLLNETGSCVKEMSSPPDEPISILTAQSIVWTQFRQLCDALEASEPRAAWLKSGGLWPCISPVTLLEMLRSVSRNQMGPGWEKALIDYAVSITCLQRLLRMDDANRKGNQRSVEDERGNIGHQNWNPIDYPDWLLLEVDGNILIRPDQVDVALATASPASGRNSVLQMNMGQGKTSCIMPMVAAILADSKRLLRVIIPKALLLQTAQILQARLGNLLGREVRHVPFSRKTPTTADTVGAFSRIHRDILKHSGIIVALPEHVMSFELSGIQRLSDGRIAEAIPMIKIQKWLRRTCRDILDECDFTLAVRTQLIYPSGNQASVDGHPHRWELAEFMLKLVEGHLWNLQQKFPRSIEVVYRQEGGFPWIFFLRKDAEEALVSRLVEDVVRSRLPMVPLQDRAVADLEAVRRFISQPQVDTSAVRRVEAMFPDRYAAKKGIYQLRGLLVHRILLLTLKKRWNVQYGLHALRDPIAVPYHAKGVPSDQAEWGHPDVAILFTCLSFYFAGLTPAQLRQSLQCILKADDPSSEYERWIQSVSSLPGPLREWNIINVDDEIQMLEIWKHFRHSVVVIDHFLNHSVFPRHSKQF